MPSGGVDYDEIAPTYHGRYALNRLAGVAAALRELAQAAAAGRILEAGCGTGRWLAELNAGGWRAHGLDLSLGMLRQARAQAGPSGRVCGRASQPPFPAACFDLIFCVNALHHFAEPRRFAAEAARLLRPGGTLAIIGMHPHARQDNWYLYDYFTETRALDLRRFPSRAQMTAWLGAAGLRPVGWRAVERIEKSLLGRQVLADPFLKKNSTSQLALLTDAAYAAGLSRIRAVLDRAEAAGETLVFPVDLTLFMLTAQMG